MKEAITSVEQDNFAEFSKKIEQSLGDKIRNRPELQKIKQEMEYLKSAKDAFASINKTKAETPAE